MYLEEFFEHLLLLSMLKKVVLLDLFVEADFQVEQNRIE